MTSASCPTSRTVRPVRVRDRHDLAVDHGALATGAPRPRGRPVPRPCRPPARSGRAIRYDRHPATAESARPPRDERDPRDGRAEVGDDGQDRLDDGVPRPGGAVEARGHDLEPGRGERPPTLTASVLAGEGGERLTRLAFQVCAVRSELAVTTCVAVGAEGDVREVVRVARRAPRPAARSPRPRRGRCRRCSPSRGASRAR